jgi:hypothetical protein
MGKSGLMHPGKGAPCCVKRGHTLGLWQSRLLQNLHQGWAAIRRYKVIRAFHDNARKRQTRRTERFQRVAFRIEIALRIALLQAHTSVCPFGPLDPENAAVMGNPRDTSERLRKGFRYGLVQSGGWRIHNVSSRSNWSIAGREWPLTQVIF